MADATSKEISDPQKVQHLRAEVDRLRLLLQAATVKRKAFSVEIEPSSYGYRIIVTGVSPEHELRAAQMVADYVNVLFKGALRWSLKWYDETRTMTAEDAEKLQGTVEAIGAPDETPVPESIR